MRAPANGKKLGIYFRTKSDKYTVHTFVLLQHSFCVQSQGEEKIFFLLYTFIDFSNLGNTMYIQLAHIKKTTIFFGYDDILNIFDAALVLRVLITTTVTATQAVTNAVTGRYIACFYHLL